MHISRVQMSTVFCGDGEKEHGRISVVWNLALQDADMPPRVGHGQADDPQSGVH